MLKASESLAKDYADYVDTLDLKLDDGTDLTSENLQSAIIDFLNSSLADAAKNVCEEQMKEDLAGNAMYSDTNTTELYNTNSEDWADFLEFDENGVPTITDYEQYLYFVSRNQPLKVTPAFSNAGLGNAQQNEDNLYGSEDKAYCPFTKYFWDNDKEKNGYGLDETGLTWDEYLATEEGQELTKQLEMSSPIPYLRSDKNGDSAPYQYVRHGMRDRDTSFALQTVLYYSLKNDDSIKDIDFLIPWLEPHSGDYDVQRAYAWLASILADADTE